MTKCKSVRATLAIMIFQWTFCIEMFLCFTHPIDLIKTCPNNPYLLSFLNPSNPLAPTSHIHLNSVKLYSCFK